MFNIVKFIRFVDNNTPKPSLSNRLRIIKNMAYQRRIGYLSCKRVQNRYDGNTK